MQITDTAAQLAELEQAVSDVLSEARRRGAAAAEVSAHKDHGLSTTVRLGELETVEHTSDNGLAITVYFGQHKGAASTGDLSPAAIREAVEAACNFAKHTQEDPHAGLADSELMATEVPDLDLYHPWPLDVDEAVAIAIDCEQAARSQDSRICNSEGASVNTNSGLGVYGNTHGFLAGYPSSRHSISCAVVGQEGESMERDYWYSTSRHADGLAAAESVGRIAAERTISRLNARRLKTRSAPVIFRAEVATGLLRSFIGAIRGAALYRRASFLLDQLGSPVFPDWVRIHENPLLPRGLSSAPFDNEGLATAPRDLVTQGILKGYALDSYSARKLDMAPTGNAGGVRNLTIESGDQDFAGLLHQMGTGLVVSELMGHGVNTVTGDYSRGASGFWVENGEIAYPVEEITIAGNLKQMFANLIAVGNDTDHPSSIRTGSWLIGEMMIAGD